MLFSDCSSNQRRQVECLHAKTQKAPQVAVVRERTQNGGAFRGSAVQQMITMAAAKPLSNTQGPT